MGAPVILTQRASEFERFSTSRDTNQKKSLSGFCPAFSVLKLLSDGFGPPPRLVCCVLASVAHERRGGGGYYGGGTGTVCVQKYRRWLVPVSSYFANLTDHKRRGTSDPDYIPGSRNISGALNGGIVIIVPEPRGLLPGASGLLLLFAVSRTKLTVSLASKSCEVLRHLLACCAISCDDAN